MLKREYDRLKKEKSLIKGIKPVDMEIHNSLSTFKNRFSIFMYSCLLVIMSIVFLVLI